MTTASFEARVMEKIIKQLKTVADVTKFIGTGDAARIYTAFISTIQDFKLPAISMQAMPSAGQAIDDAELETIDLQLDFWMKAGTDANANTWDDVMECWAAAKNELHNNGGWDTVIGINILMIENISRGPQLYEQDTKIMHYQTRFRIRGTVS